MKENEIESENWEFSCHPSGIMYPPHSVSLTAFLKPPKCSKTDYKKEKGMGQKVVELQLNTKKFPYYSFLI
jgi:hypothetical protein